MEPREYVSMGMDLENLSREERLFLELGSKKEPLELIVKVGKDKIDAVAEDISRFGDITHLLTLIPYLSFRCDQDAAMNIANHKYKNTCDAVFEKEFRSMLNLIGSLEIASSISVGPPGDKITEIQSIFKKSPSNLKQIGAYNAQKHSTGKGVKVGIIDTGIDYTHPDLASLFGPVKGYDFVERDDDPMDENGHGTHVAGTVASVKYGIATDAVLYGIRILDALGYGSEASAIAGIEWAVKNGLDIVNMSFGLYFASQAFEDMCRNARESGLYLVAAAGNDPNYPSYPAAFGDPVIAVAALDSKNNRAPFSNIYYTNDISAPGVDIISTYLAGKYAKASGTSMASPHVTGSLALAIALARSKNLDLEQLMKDTAKKLSSKEPTDPAWLFGAGLIQADKLVNEVMKRP